MPRKASSTKARSKYDKAQDKKIKYLMNQVGQEEIKTFDDYGSAAPILTISHLLPIAEGTGPKERVGLKVLLKHFHFKYYLNMNGSNTQNPQVNRVMIIRDNQSDGAVPTYANVFPGQRLLEEVNRTTEAGRFSILYDKIHHCTISATGVPTGQVGSGSFKVSYKRGKDVVFDGAAATDTRNGQLFLMCKSSDVTNSPTITWESRGLYTDA